MTPPSASMPAGYLISNFIGEQNIIDIFLGNILPRSARLFEFLLPGALSFSLGSMISVLLAATVCYFLITQKEGTKKFHVLLFMFAIIQFLIVAALLSNDPINPFPVR
jgi:hypothetical protein